MDEIQFHRYLKQGFLIFGLHDVNARCDAQEIPYENLESSDLIVELL